jgi:FAD/FMN-containing dehydrogenase
MQIADVNRTDKRDGRLWNWGGNLVLHAQANAVVCPRTEAELVALIQEQQHRRQQTGRGGVKVVGSLLAASPMAAAPLNSEGMLVSLVHFASVVRQDATSITVGAGMQLCELYNLLLDQRRALTCSPGVITYQTIGGAIASCTHGQGLYQSSLSDIVSSVRVVLASGEVLVIDDADPRLGAFRASLGCLGVITEITLRTTAAHLMTCVKEATNMDSLIPQLATANAAHFMFKSWWFPLDGSPSGDVHVVTIFFLLLLVFQS